MGNISLKEMNDSKVEKMDNGDYLGRDDDMRDLELMEKYERLGDLVLTSLHGNFECTIPKETFMEKTFNSNEIHGDDYQKDEDLHVKLKIVPGSKLYRTGLGPETEIADIVPPHRVIGLGDIDFGRIEFNSDPVNPKNKYEYDTIIDFDYRLESLEKGSRDRWVEKNADKFKSIEDAGDYYDKNWHLLTDVDYYKENLIRTSKGEKVQRDQSNAVYGKIVHPNWTESKTSEIFYTKPRAVLSVNGKEVDILPEKLREKIIVDARNQDEAVKRQLPTSKQADSLINLISEQVEDALDIPNAKEVEEFGKFIEKVDKDVWVSVEFQDDDYTFTLELQSDMIEDGSIESATYNLNRRSLEAAKRDVENFVKDHKVAVREEESGLEFRDDMYESLEKLEYERVLINGETKYGGEWLQEIGNSKDGDEIFRKPVEVYRRSNDGYNRVFEIEPKEVLQLSVASPDLTTKHQAIEKDAEER